MPVISALRRRKQSGKEFKNSHSYIVNSRTLWAA